MYTSYDFVSKKGEFKLKTKVFKFLGIQPNYDLYSDALE